MKFVQKMVLFGKKNSHGYNVKNFRIGNSLGLPMVPFRTDEFDLETDILKKIT